MKSNNDNISDSEQQIFTLNEHTFDLLFFSLKNLIGNSYLVKCISNVNEQDKYDLVNIQFSKCFSQILEELIIVNDLDKNPFYNYLINSISNYHNTHICSTKTVTIFTILLYKNVKSIVDKNSLSITLTVKYLRLILNECIELVNRNLIRKIEIKFASNFPKMIISHMKNEFINYNVKQNSDYYKKLLHGISRHQIKIADVLYDLLLMVDEQNIQFNSENINLLSNSVAFTKKRDQLANYSNSSFNQEFNYKIIKGTALKIDDIDNLDCIKSCLNNNQDFLTFNAVLIESSLVSNNIHLGFNKTLNVNEIITSNIFDKRECEDYNSKWRINLEKILIDFKINLVFVRDNIDKNLIDFFKQNSIVHFSNLSPELIRYLKNNNKCSSLVYIEDFKLDKIFKIRAGLINDKTSSLKLNYLNIQTVNEINDEIKFTILLETKLNSLTDMHEEYLRHSLKRLHNILRTCVYLNGSGEVEEFIAENLKNNLNIIKTDEQDENFYYDLIKEVYEKTFRAYYTIVKHNNEHNDSNLVVDDCLSKFEAWKTSCSINETLLNSDISLTY
jgi:hypothetical protein